LQSTQAFGQSLFLREAKLFQTARIEGSVYYGCLVCINE